MIRQIVGAITGVVLSLMFMYFMLPSMVIEHTQTSLMFNGTDPVIQQSYAFGSGFYTVLPFIPLIVSAFVLMSYALRRGPMD